MKITLKRVGLPTDYALKSAHEKIITGELKSSLRARWPIRILRKTGDEIVTAAVRRVGHGWVITEDASYIISFHSAVPSQPAEFYDHLENYFHNEDVIFSRLRDLIAKASEIRDFPVARDNGYPEFVSRALNLALEEQADIASEGDYPINDTIIAITAVLSYKSSELLRRIYNIDYRSRAVFVGTSHRVRGIEKAEQVLHAVAVYAEGRVLHCLVRELPIEIKELAKHSSRLYSLAHRIVQHERTQRHRKSRRGCIDEGGHLS